MEPDIYVYCNIVNNYIMLFLVLYKSNKNYRYIHNKIRNVLHNNL